MRGSNMLKRDPEDVLDIYFQQCSLLVNCRDLAIMAAALANRGVNPITAMPSEFVLDVLTVMHSCGMYGYAGHWSHEVGIPAKSGVSGCLDAHGNSVRAIMPAVRFRQTLACRRRVSFPAGTRRAADPVQACSLRRRTRDPRP
jgi:glutaminase